MADYMKRMRDLREDNDKTQNEIAELLGTSQTMYARYERGANELPPPSRHSLQILQGQRRLLPRIFGQNEVTVGLFPFRRQRPRFSCRHNMLVIMITVVLSSVLYLLDTFVLRLSVKKKN